MGGSPIDPAGFAAIIEQLYAGTLDDVTWDRGIVGVADLVRASGALLMAFNPSTSQILRHEHHRFDQAILREYHRHWSYHDYRMAGMLEVPSGVPVTERTLKLPDDWAKTAVYNEFLVPSDVPYFMPAWLHKSPTKAVTLSFQGTRKRGPFETRDIEIYRQVLPHISRAVEIRDRLERAQVRADSLAKNLETLSFGVAVLDSTGKAIEINSVLEDMLRSGNGVRRNADGTLCLRDPAGVQLKRWISTGVPPASSLDGLLRVPRLNALPLSIVVTQLPISTTSWIGRDPRWLVLAFDPYRRISISAKLIARDLGISARESEVAAMLVTGHTVRNAAKRLGVSEHTARAQLKSIFRKTGTHSQSDLVRRIALGPAGSVTALQADEE